MLLTPETQNFISQHREDDVRKLALRPVKEPGVDLRTALEQIAGWQKARLKLPRWAAKDGIIYPPHISMEQCSSQQTAEYKAVLASRIVSETNAMVESTFVDLTGGFGVDFSFMAVGFKKAVYVERQEHLCRIAEHNFQILNLTNASVVNTSAEDYLDNMSSASLVFLDPARRDSVGQRTYAVADCTPDVLSLKELLLRKAAAVMVKLSPMLDWRKTVSDFGGAVSEVHILAVGGECKELLLVLNREKNNSVSVFCVNDGDELRFNTADVMPSAEPYDLTKRMPAFICEPNAAVMKGGCFALVEQRFGVKKVGANSNLFLSDTMPKGFPGRVFAVSVITTMNRRELKTALEGIERANITVRNFPLSVNELRRRLKLKDGGDVYIFATTDNFKRHALVISRRL